MHLDVGDIKRVPMNTNLHGKVSGYFGKAKYALVKDGLVVHVLPLQWNGRDYTRKHRHTRGNGRLGLPSMLVPKTDP